MRERLRSLLYSALPEEPDRELVMALAVEDGWVDWTLRGFIFTWTVSTVAIGGDLDGSGEVGGEGIGGILSGGNVVTVGATQHVELPYIRLDELKAALEATGVTVSAFPSDLATQGITGCLLLDGAGNSRMDNGGLVYLCRAQLHAVLTAMALPLWVADRKRPAALAELNLQTADGWWLDYFGSVYGIARRAGDNDATYAEKIKREVFRPRDNGPAIENAVLDGSGLTVEIYETWRNVFILDQSILSGPDALQSDYFGRCIIVPIVRDPFVTPDQYAAINALVDRNRAAGVIALPARADATVQEHVVAHAALADASILRWRSALVEYPDRPRLDVDLLLSDSLLVSEHPTAILRTRAEHIRPGHTRSWAFGGWDSGTWGDDTPVDDIPIYHTRLLSGGGGGEAAIGESTIG